MIRNYKLDALAYLQSTKPNCSIENGSKKTLKRRASVAGGGLFSVQNRVQETGFDYLPRVLPNKRFGSISNNANNILNIPNVSNGVAIAIRSTTYNEKHGGNSERIQNDQNELNGEANTLKSNNGIKGLQPSNATTIAMTSIANEENEIENFVQNVRNSSIDSLAPIPSPIHNDFNPSRRLPNVPFSKRPRANSLFDSRRPSLHTLTEEEMNIPDEPKTDTSAEEAENMRKWMNITFQ